MCQTAVGMHMPCAGTWGRDPCELTQADGEGLEEPSAVPQLEAWEMEEDGDRAGSYRGHWLTNPTCRTPSVSCCEFPQSCTVSSSPCDSTTQGGGDQPLMYPC